MYRGLKLAGVKYIKDMSALGLRECKETFELLEEWIKPKTQFEFWLEAANRKILIELYNSSPNLDHYPLTYKKNRNYIKILRFSNNRVEGAVWGFVSMKDNQTVKGSVVMKGDLLKPVNFHQPTAHARGNVLNGTAKFEWTGPSYLRR